MVENSEDTALFSLREVAPLFERIDDENKNAFQKMVDLEETVVT